MSDDAAAMSASGRSRRRRNPEASMPLLEHLRELRTRVVVSAIAIAVGTVVGWYFYDALIGILSQPWDTYQSSAAAQGITVPELVITGIATPFTLRLQVSAVAGLLVASPVWLVQIWRFVTPGLRTKERRWTAVFLVVAVPLLLAGVVLGYLFLPKGLSILLGFTPAGVSNLITVTEYFTFVTRMLLVFGVAFLLPVFVVLLNAVGVLTAERLRSWWRGIIFGVFVFAAVATPTGDPWTMLALATPMLVLLLVAFVVAWANDRRRAKAAA